MPPACALALPQPAPHVRQRGINVASITQVQAWIGHADVKTTMRYLNHKSRADDAQLLRGVQPKRG